jgi:hypothetical protein
VFQKIILINVSLGSSWIFYLSITFVELANIMAHFSITISLWIEVQYVYLHPLLGVDEVITHAMVASWSIPHSLLVKVFKHESGWCCWLNFFSFFLIFCFLGCFSFFSSLLIYCKIYNIYALLYLFCHYIEVNLQLWKYFQHLGKYYLYSLPRTNEVIKEYGS